MNERQLRALLDKQEITEVCFRYGIALDDRDWDALSGCFTPDAVADYGDPQPCRGYREIEGKCRAALEPLSVTQHLIGNVTVRLDGDEADVRSYLHGQHVRPGTPGGEQFVMAGRYVDRFVRTAEGWRIAQRRLEVAWTAGNPAVVGRPPAQTRQAEVTGGPSAR